MSVTEGLPASSSAPAPMSRAMRMLLASEIQVRTSKVADGDEDNIMVKGGKFVGGSRLQRALADPEKH